jgi:hypothetical protein
MNRSTVIIVCLLLASSLRVLNAQDAPPPPEKAPPTPAELTDGEEPAEQPAPAPAPAPLASWISGRNPFWPIGYEPPLSISDDSRRRLQLEARARWPKLQHTPPTRLPSGDIVTIINGYGLAEAGTIIRVEKEGLVYRWRITAIDEQGIQAKRLPLRAVRP